MKRRPASLDWAGVVLLLVALTGFAPPALAQVPVKQRQFVYRVYGFDGRNYVEAFYPDAARTLYLHADTDNVVIAKRTLVYFWPPAKEYLPDWLELDETVAGVAEIQGRGLQRSIPLNTFALVHAPRYAGPTQVLAGEEARRKYEAYQAAMRDFWARGDRYYQDLEAYDRQLQEITKAGKATGPMPRRPTPPPPPSLYVADPAEGFVVNLPPGRYSLRVRAADGTVIPQSVRTLEAFAPRREGIGYVVIPEQKWAMPQRLDDPRKVLYISGERVVFVQPFLMREYPEFEWSHLRNPQTREGSQNRWTWAFNRALEDVTVELVSPEGTQQATRKTYYIKRTPTLSLGYEVVEWPQPDLPEGEEGFRGYRLVLPAGPGAEIQVSQAGRIREGSRRSVVRLRLEGRRLLYLPSILPLLLGLVLVARGIRGRRREDE